MPKGRGRGRGKSVPPPEKETGEPMLRPKSIKPEDKADQAGRQDDASASMPAGDGPKVDKPEDLGETPVQDLHRVGHTNVEVRIAGGPSQTFSLDKPYTMLELLQSTLGGYNQGSWKLTLDDYPVKHEDLITFFAPLARKDHQDGPPESRTHRPRRWRCWQCPARSSQGQDAGNLAGQRLAG